MAAPVLSFTVATPSPYTTGTITDNSTYVSPARSGYGVFILAQKMDYRGEPTSLTTTGDLGNPGTNTIFTFSLTGDGWYRFVYVAAPIYNIGTTYAKYAIVYVAATTSLYQSQIDSNLANAVTNPAAWRVVNDLGTIYTNSLTNPVTEATVAAYNRILVPNTQAAFGTQASASALEGVTDAYRRIDVQRYEFLGLALDAMAADETAQLYNEGEKVARRAALIIAGN